MKRNSWVVCVLMIVFLGVCLAQAPNKPPAPGPEHKRLGYFVGSWSLDGDFVFLGKVTGIQNFEWGPGGFSLLIHGAIGSGKSIAIMAYDTKEKVYTYNSWDSMGTGESAKGNVKAGTWTWTGEFHAMDGTAMKSRTTIKEVSPTAATYQFEISKDGNTWETMMEGKQTKVTKKTN